MNACGDSDLCVLMLNVACLPVSHFIVPPSFFFACELQKRRRRIDRTMIGEPTNFVHMTHVGSGDMGMGLGAVSIVTLR